MSRTKGSGWGGGPLLYQPCPLCGQKKAYYDPLDYLTNEFKCTNTHCKQRFSSKTLERKTQKR